MTPTDNQKQLIDFFIERIERVRRMDVSAYTTEIQELGNTIDSELAEWGIQNDHVAGDAIRDLVMVIVKNP